MPTSADAHCAACSSARGRCCASLAVLGGDAGAAQPEPPRAAWPSKRQSILPDMVLQVPCCPASAPVDLDLRRSHARARNDRVREPQRAALDRRRPLHPRAGVAPRGRRLLDGRTAPVARRPTPRAASPRTRRASGVVMLVPFSDRLDDWHRAGGDRRARCGVPVRAARSRRSTRRAWDSSAPASAARWRWSRRRTRASPTRSTTWSRSAATSMRSSTFGAIVTHHIEYTSVDETWTPKLARGATSRAHQLIDRLDSPNDQRSCSTRRVHRRQTPLTPAQLASLTPVGRSSYNFLANRDPAAVAELIAPAAGRRRRRPELPLADARASIA